MGLDVYGHVEQSRQAILAKVFLALGSNVGDRKTNCCRALLAIAAIESHRIVDVSKVYETLAVGGPADQDPYLNAVIAIETTLSPQSLFQQMQAIERKLGRPPAHERIPWGPRIMDIDILLYESQIIQDQTLAIPHPRMAERWFVLKPLCDIAADMQHPQLGESMSSLLSKLPEEAYDQAETVEMDLAECLSKTT